jgi:hypothetical protein
MGDRSHEQIIRDASTGTTDAELTARLGFPAEHIQRIRDWRRRKRIPPEWWTRVVAAGWTTLEELSSAVAAPDSDLPSQGEAA